MTPTIIFILLALVSTFAGGLLALKYKDKLHLILGFTAGILLSVVAFDLLPEIIEMTEGLGIDPIVPMTALVAGFLLFHIFEKLLVAHHAHEDTYGEHKHPAVGVFSALALSAHSFLDGVGIGLGFQISNEVGILVAIAVLSHGFSDGLNTVSLMLTHGNTSKRAFKLLTIDAVAPVLGGLSTLLFSVPEKYLLIYLGFFAGFFLYIGASDILPEAHRRHSSWKTIFATLLGVGFIYVFTQLV